MLPVLMSFEVSPLLDIAWAILEFAVDYVWIFCGLIFVLVMAKAITDNAKRIAEWAGPRISKITSSRRRG
jgi:hypothetical protein